jgi:hypothetical protein
MFHYKLMNASRATWDLWDKYKERLIFQLTGILFFLFLSISAAAQTPLITSYSPQTASPGSTITISGSNFDPSASGNVVFFGPVTGTVTAATSTSLTVTVPLGAGYAPLSVLNLSSGLAARSSAYFMPAFTPNKSGFTSSDMASPVSFATGVNPAYVASGDLDGDGKPDLVVTNQGDGTASLYRNTSSIGTISFDKTDIASDGSGNVALTDIDGDGKLDMIILNQGARGIMVFRNTGSPGLISFDTPKNFAAGAFPNSMVLADFDADGKTDVATSSFQFHSISVLQNTSTPGNINFAAKTDIATPSDPYYIAAADLNGDHKPELLLANFFDNSISIYRNTSSGGISFGSNMDVALNDTPLYLTAADVNNDGTEEVIVGNASSISILSNTAIGGSISMTRKDIGSGSGAYAVVIADFNGDGKADLATMDGGNVIYVNRGTGNTGTISFDTQVEFYASSYTVALGAADLDGDGRPDLFSTQYDENLITIFRNKQPAASSVSTLSSLTGSVGLSPGFQSTTLNYTVSVPYNTQTIRVTPTLTDIKASLTVNGTAVSSGSLSGSIPLVVGANEIKVVVTAEDGTSTSTYTVTVTRAALSTISTLSALSLNPGTLSGGFTSATLNYTASVLNSITSIQLRPTANNSAASIKVNGTVVASGSESSGIPLTVGSNTLTIIVTAEDGTSTSTYTVTVTRAALSTVSTLSALSLNPGALSGGFTSATLNYTASVLNSITSIQLTPTASSSAASIKVNGVTVASGSLSAGIPLSVGANTITIVVTAEDGTSTSTYTLIVTRQAFNAPPVVSSFSPLKAAPGEQVIITGTGLNSTAANNIVFFGATQAVVNTATATSLTVTVPTGATHASIRVLNKATGLAGWSSALFLPIFSPVKATLTALDFEPVTYFGIGGKSSSIVMGDLDGDGKPDLVTANELVNTVTVMKNTSIPGTLQFSNVQFSANAPASALLADLDGDGRTDIVTVSTLGIVSVLLNNSSGGVLSFAAQQNFSLNGSVFIYSGNISAGDLNGDGLPDLVFAKQSEKISVLLNTCEPGRISFAPYQDIAAGKAVKGITVADLDGDGKPDIAAGTDATAGGGILVLYNATSAGGALQFNQEYSQNFGQDIYYVTPTDLDSDGRLDLIAVSYYTASLALRNLGNKQFGEVVYIPSKINFSASTGDLNGDGSPDVAIMGEFPSLDRFVWLSKSDGSFGVEPTPVLGDIESGQTYTIQIGDLDGDGLPDLAGNENLLEPKVWVIRQRPASSALSNLQADKGTLSPVFSPASLNYTLLVPVSTSSVSITPTVADATATMTVNGMAVSSGTAVVIPISTIDVEVSIAVTAQNGAVNTYRITITRGSSVSTLSSVKMDGSVSGLAFNSNTLTYTASVPYSASSVQLDFKATNTFSSMKLNGVAVTGSSVSQNMPLNVGSNNFTIAVTSQDATTTTTYTVNITRAALSTVSTLSALSLSSNTLSIALNTPFVSTTGNYTGTVANSVTSVRVTPASTDPAASIKVNGLIIPGGSASGDLPLGVGTNTITTVVTSADGSSTSSYSVVLTRSPTYVSTLQSLQANDGVFDRSFDENVTSYTLTVSSNISHTWLVAIVADGLASTKINGVDIGYDNGVSGTIYLNAASTSVPIEVTARDGSNKTVYTITIIRSAYIPPPLVTSFSPQTTLPGSTITISGSNFNSTASNNVVYMGPVRATVTAATATSLTVTVPTGAGYAPLRVSNLSTGLSGQSSAWFMPAFTPNKSGFAASDLAGPVDIQTSPVQAVSGDMDGDGKPDLVVLGKLSVWVLRNTGSPGTISFDKIVVAPGNASGNSSVRLVLADLDGDGRLDIITSDPGNSKVKLLRNTGSSGHISFAALQEFNTGGNTSFLTVSDFDADGRPDIAIGVGSRSLAIWHNSSSQGSISFGSRTDILTTQDVGDIAAADLNSDNKPELLTISYNDASLSVFQNTSTGSISFSTAIVTALGDTPNTINTADLNKDGRTDVIVGSSNSIVILENTGTGGNISFAKTAISTTYSQQALATADLNGDGKVDLLSIGTSDNRVYVMPGTGSTGVISFGPATGFYANNPAYALGTADLDSDGRPDIFTITEENYYVSIYRNTLSGPALSSSESSLSSLGISNANLSETFAPATLSYTAIVPNSVASVYLTLAATNSAASIKVNNPGGCQRH